MADNNQNQNTNNNQNQGQNQQNQNNSGSGGGQGGGSGAGGDGFTFDKWQASWSPEQKAGYEEHTKGLKSALDGERTTKAGLEKQIKDLIQKAEKGSEMETKLTAIDKELQTARGQAEFYEQAVAAGVKDLKLAWLAATSGDLFKKNGSVDFEELKKLHPAVFGTTTATNANAGSGAGGGGGNAGGQTVDQLIRKAAGHGG